MTIECMYYCYLTLFINIGWADDDDDDELGQGDYPYLRVTLSFNSVEKDHTRHHEKKKKGG